MPVDNLNYNLIQTLSNSQYQINPVFMLKALIIDDETKAREVLIELIGLYTPEISTLKATGDVREGLALIKNFQPDLLFLDVIMPQMNGFDLLEALGEWNFDIIFTTAFNEYAIQAVRLSALDYLLKPIDPDDLQIAVRRYLEKKKSQDPQSALYKNFLRNLKVGRDHDFRLAIPTTDGVYFYETKEIIRCEADRNYTQFYLTNNRRFLASRTLKEYEEILSVYGFLRVHKSHLINLDFTENYLGKGGIRMKDQTEIEVARRRREQVMMAMQNRD
ncbi:MAG: DNA-binding response regulator [Saprospiraceae bacterium]|nr:MAG: DNA-binding response regulator [Saprospiraceae bacterium]